MLWNILCDIWTYTAIDLCIFCTTQIWSTTKCLLIIIITPVVFSICFSRAWMEAHGSARLSRKRKREGSNGEAEEGQKALKLKRYTVVSEMKVCTDERWYLSSKAVLLLAPQGLKYPAPYADQLESMEEKLYQRVTMEEARKGTPRRLCALCSKLPFRYTHALCYFQSLITWLQPGWFNGHYIRS